MIEHLKQTQVTRELIKVWGMKAPNSTVNERIKQLEVDLDLPWICQSCSHVNQADIKSTICEVCGAESSVRETKYKRLGIEVDGKCEEIHSRNKLTEQILEDFMSDFDDEHEDQYLRSDKVDRTLETQCGENFISLIPEDVLVQMCFVYLDIAALRCAMNVCKSWHYTCRSDVLWQPLHKIYVLNAKSEMRPRRNRSPLTSHLPISNNAVSTHPSVEPTWECPRCSLTQALPTSEWCEMCGEPCPNRTTQTSAVVTSPPVAHTVITSTTQLAQLCAAGRLIAAQMESNRLNGPGHETSSSMDYASVQPHGQTFYSGRGNSTEYSSSENCCEQSWTVGMPSCSGAHSQGRWYFWCKQSHSDRLYRTLWQSLADSWHWLRISLRNRLSATWKSSLFVPKTHSSERHVNCTGDGVPHGSLVRATQKLTVVNWIRLYDSLKEELVLQADAVCDDITHWHRRCGNTTLGIRNDVEFILWVVRACDAYIEWCGEVESCSYPLTERIVIDRERAREFSRETHAEDQGSTQNTPFLEDVGLIALRERVLLQFRQQESIISSLKCICEAVESQVGVGTHSPRPPVFTDQELLSDRVMDFEKMGALNRDSPCRKRQRVNSNINNTGCNFSELNVLLKPVLAFYDLIKILDVPDDCMSSFSTRGTLRNSYFVFLLSQPSLATFIRQHERSKNVFLQDAFGLSDPMVQKFSHSDSDKEKILKTLMQQRRFDVL
mmetsp:Transcript_611/g.1023  ORF Transcript_611/g.1023 Transcript_611/m.1023 type:complete len:721 (+) Transcript_611:240-2402(+)|eukprot:CAMPEP_0185031844 /NCGR_PEP_ID=MMETSP1103-20130426/19515_1 /TAXON_ID=36769 /ORGANISM="Paraphysomonas bandaiensis, Strain Caron Lab Isolate" /LENGTH=720 /DNA_ID=CAMNT_0027567501 /DNA_START=178 /DNA_END=2340 /DNA_ORIENTATION=+